jgi:hypothetical protein
MPANNGVNLVAALRGLRFIWHQMTEICDRLWENPAKVATQNSEKKGKVKTKFLIFFVFVW